jgi:probable HAF family extracellular repeat protein
LPTIDGAAVLWWRGQAHDLNDLVLDGEGFVLRTAESVNDAGQIVGFGTRDGQTHAFRLEPTRR